MSDDVDAHPNFWNTPRGLQRQWWRVRDALGRRRRNVEVVRDDGDANVMSLSAMRMRSRVVVVRLLFWLELEFDLQPAFALGDDADAACRDCW